MTTPRVTVPVDMKCSKCGARSGDDWEQCFGSCPMPGSPHYSAAPAPEGGAVTHRQASDHAANSDDPLAAMLRDVDDRLNRDDPDIPGARASLHGARLAASYRALTTRSDVKPEGGAVRAWMFRESPSERWHVTMDRRSVDEYLKAFSTAEVHPLAIATREESPAEAGELGGAMERLGSAADFLEGDCVIVGDHEVRGNDLLAVLSALRVQPPAREDAQPVDATWHYTKDCPAPDALRVAVEAYLTAVDDLEIPVMSPSLGLHRKEAASQARGKLREALAALQAEQKGGA